MGNLKDLVGSLKIEKVKKKYKCPYCKVSFAKESTLIAHSCDKKRRLNSQNDLSFRVALEAYQKFYRIAQRVKKDKTVDDFIMSRYYNEFIKFGSFVANVNPLYITRYIDYVITKDLKIQLWYKDETYFKYVEEIIYTESIDSALERSIKTMSEWAETVNGEWNHYFKYCNNVKSLMDLRDGKISPWLVLNCPTGVKMIENYSDKELELVFNLLNPNKWKIIFSRNKSDLDFVLEIVKKSNL